MIRPVPPELPFRITFSAVDADDFEELVGIRISAMRESLEAVGRFDVDRARERLRNSFHPEHTEVIALDGQRIGFYTLRPADAVLHLDHLYIHPRWQSLGIGSYVMFCLIARANADCMPICLTALRNSPSNRFYRRYGFVQTEEDEWDIHYTRVPEAIESGAAS